MTSFARYAAGVDPDTLVRREFDILVVGSGVAGLTAALRAARHGRVAVVTKGRLAEGSTPHAQGGIAAALCPEDSPAFHLQDTMIAGAGLCSREAVSVLVTEGPERVRELIALGARFDMEGGRLLLGREGAHGQRRIAHAQGDATGLEVERTLVQRVRESEIEVLEGVLVTDAVTVEGACVGVLALDAGNAPLLLQAKATILATGGAGQLYRNTTNPPVVTGDGMALAYRAGAVLTDLEFFQFHPTALALDMFPKFLISEAVRGEGAHLLDAAGERFMLRYDDRKELAPRDIVTRAIWEEASRTGSDHVDLDLSFHSREAIRQRFPTIYQTCLDHGIDAAEDPIPVFPTAHYFMGGVKTDLHCRTTVEGLLACGEVACTGVHGANRLASNSMLEGLVFGVRAAEATRALLDRDLPIPDDLPVPRGGAVAADRRQALRELMWDRVGIVRTAAGLQGAVDQLSAWALQAETGADRDSVEQRSMLLLGSLLARAALTRQESRGAHYRSDLPDTDDANWQGHLELRAKRLNDGSLDLEPEIEFVPERSL